MHWAWRGRDSPAPQEHGGELGSLFFSSVECTHRPLLRGDHHGHIYLARDGAPSAQQSALCALAAFQLPRSRDCDFPIPVLVREGIAELVREGAIPLMMALARGSSDTKVSEAAFWALNVLAADHPFGGSSDSRRRW